MSRSFLLESPEILNGIGSDYGKRLAKAGIPNIGVMFRMGPGKVFGACKGASKKQVGNWFCAASLLHIPGMTASVADLLVQAGARSVRKVALIALEKLETDLKKADSRHKVDIYTLSKLQQSASQTLERGLFIGRILSKNGKPVANVQIDIGEFDTLTDPNGWFAFDQLPARQYKPRAYFKGQPDPLCLTQAAILAGRLYGPVVIKCPKPKAASKSAHRDVHELDGYRIVNTRSTTTRLDDISLAEFRSGTLCEVRKIAGGKASLLGLHLVKRGLTILVQRTKVPQNDLPPGSKIGSVLLWRGGKLQSTEYTRQQVNEQKRAAAKEKHTRRSVTRIRVQLGKGMVHLGK